MNLPRWILGPLVRRTLLNDWPEVTFRVATTQAELSAANALVDACYVSQGRIRLNEQTDWSRVNTHRHDRLVVCAWAGNDLVGTMTIVRDTGAGTLPAEADTPHLIEQERAGGVVAEFTRMAIQRPWRNSGLAPLLGLAVGALGRELLGADRFVCRVLKNAAPVYEELYGFQKRGTFHHKCLEQQVLVLGATAQEMCHHLEHRYQGGALATGVRPHLYCTGAVPVDWVEMAPVLVPQTIYATGG